MPNPESSPAPQTPAPPTQTTPITNAAPGSEAQSKLAAELERLFPGGAIPDGGRFNSEATMMRSAGRESSVQAAAATPPGSIVGANIQGPAAVQPVVPVQQPAAPIVQPAAAPAAPAAPAASATQPVPTPEEKAKADADKTAADKATAEADAIKAAAAGAAKKSLSESERDAAEKIMTPQAGTAFKTLRNELKEARDAIAAKEKELADYQKKIAEAVPTTEAEKLKETLRQTQERLAIFDYRATEEYQSQVAQPLASVESEIVALATKGQIPEADLQAALNDPDPNRRSDRLAELSSNFNRIDLNRFDRLVAAREDYQSFGKQLESQAQDKIKNYQQFQEAEMLKAQETAKAEWSKALDATQEELAKTMPIFAPTGDAQFDADMNAAIENVRTTDLAKLSNPQIAETFYKASAFPLVLQLVTNLHNKNVELSNRVQQLSGTAAPAGGGHAPAAEVVQPTFTSMQEAVRTLPQILP